MNRYNKIAILLILIQAIIGLQLYAQPVLTQSNNAPVVGDSFILNFIDVSSITEGSSGANVTWDFSGLSSIGIINKNWVNPTSTPNDTFFTEANLAYYDTITDGWMYYSSNSNELLFIGFVINQSENKYTDFIKMRGFSFNYNSNYSDNFSCYTLYQQPEDSIIGDVELVADAYGVLILPNCTINNILRIKRINNDITYLNSFGTTLTHNNEEYLWFMEGVHEPVLYLSNDLTNGISYDKGYYLENIPNGIAEYGENTGFYPNPASEFIIIETGQNTGSETVVEITGINGKTYIQTTIDKNSRVDISGLSPGIYFVKVNNGKSMKVNKLIVR